LDKAIRNIAAVREAVGDQVDLLIEAHGRFDVPTGIKIAQEIAPFKPMFRKCLKRWRSVISR